MDKIWEDIYSSLKGRWWGVPLIILAVLFIVVYAIWNSLPDSAKERILTPKEQTTKKEVVVSKRSANENLKQSIDLEKSKEIPDLGKALRVIRALSIKDLVIEGETVKDVSPNGVQGYFSVDIPPSEGAYSSANILLSKEISPNLFVTTRIAAGAGMFSLQI